MYIVLLSVAPVIALYCKQCLNNLNFKKKCVRGSRTPFRSKTEQSLDCKINVACADI